MYDTLKIGETDFHSRLIMGSGKFSSSKTLSDSLEASGTRMVTVALRRVNLDDPKDNILSVIDLEKYILLPNTSGAQNATEAIRLARLARSSGISDWIKIEVTPDPRTLLPDGEETLEAAKILVKDGFKVMPYINADPILAKKLEEIGCVSVMPLGSPIGTNQGLSTKDMISIIIEQSNVPVIVDAGIGKPSEAAAALEMGASAVLVNTAIATAQNPVLMAQSFKKAVEAGHCAYLAGLPITKEYANASSPWEWISQI